jgi:uncharacterized protein
MMDFEWDETKSERNRVKRGLPFRTAIELFDGFVVERVDDRRNYGEKRVTAIGVSSGRILACVSTDRGSTRRIISLRNASRSERDGDRSVYPG